MIQSEYNQKKRECWDEIAAEVAVEPQNLLCKAIAYIAFGRAYALGKQEKDAEDIVIQGWVSRDKDGALIFWESKPQRNNITNDEWGMANGIMLLPYKLFPDLTWDSDPEEVELIIKKKEEWIATNSKNR